MDISLQEIEEIEKLTLRWVFQAVLDFGMEAHEIFLKSPDSVKDIAEDPIDLAMVKSINEIGQVMGKQTIAEFVENEAILSKLRELGVDYAQGYGIGRPCPIETMS